MPLMRCELKDHEADHLVLLPIHKPDGDVLTTACLEHARESEYFCHRHDAPHQGFFDGSHACLGCIEDRVKTLANLADSYDSMLRTYLSSREYGQLAEWSEISGEITGDSPAVCLLRAIVTTSIRRGMTDQDVVQEAITEGSIKVILPPISK